MADDVTLAVDLLRCGIVVGLSVDEITGFKVVDSHLDGESGVGGEVLTVHGYNKLRRRHVRRRGDDTQRCRVARACLNLLSVRDRQVGNGKAEIDEVVVRREGSNLTSGGCLLPVLLETNRDDIRVER